jgi:hypothetical protein
MTNGRIRVCDRFAQRSGTVIVCVGDDKVLARAGEVRRLRSAQVVKGLVAWAKCESDDRRRYGVVAARGKFE